MPDLVCQPSIVPPPPVAGTGDVIGNDGFFPDIDVATLCQEMRIRDVAPERLRMVICAAIVTVGNDLATFRAEKIGLGFDTLEGVPSLTLAGENISLFLYRRAVGCLAKAELVERYRDVDTTAEGQRKAGELDPTIDELRRDGRHAVRDLLGRTRTTVALI